MNYGKELILDLHDCNPCLFTRPQIELFFKSVCRDTEMRPCELYWWDDVGVEEDEKQTEPHLKGTSAVQFIMTSNITIHTLELLKAVYINFFSCKGFNSDTVAVLAELYFEGKIVNRVEVTRL